MKQFLIITGAVIVGVFLSNYFFSDDQPAPKIKPENQDQISSETAPKIEPEAAPTLPDSLFSEAAENARVFFIEPSDGAVVASPVKIKFGIENMSIVPAGDQTQLSGHHHLLIDLAELPPMDQPLPANEQVIHFGGGQTETEIELAAGMHSLQLLLGNFAHIPHKQPVLSEKITITVE